MGDDLGKHLLETFDNPEVRFVTFERTENGWDMRRYTRVLKVEQTSPTPRGRHFEEG